MFRRVTVLDSLRCGKISPDSNDFLYKNGALYDGDGNKKLSDHTLAVLTIMVAESRVEEKEMMVTIIMNCI